MRHVLLELKTLIATPIKRFEDGGADENQAPVSTPSERQGDSDVADGDLPELITRLMGKSAFCFKSYLFSSQVTVSCYSLVSGRCIVECKVVIFLCVLFAAVCSQLLICVRPEDECFSLYLQLVDRCRAHEVGFCAKLHTYRAFHH